MNNNDELENQNNSQLRSILGPDLMKISLKGKYNKPKRSKNEKNN